MSAISSGVHNTHTHTHTHNDTRQEEALNARVGLDIGSNISHILGQKSLPNAIDLRGTIEERREIVCRCET